MERLKQASYLEVSPLNRLGNEEGREVCLTLTLCSQSVSREGWCVCVCVSGASRSLGAMISLSFFTKGEEQLFQKEGEGEEGEGEDGRVQ